MFHKDLNLADLVNLENWQKTQDQFADALEITLRTISSQGEFLSRPSRPNRLCGDILTGTPLNNTYCDRCFTAKGKKLPIETLEKETNLKCPFGLDVFVVPVKAVSNKTIAYIVIGPLILKSRKSVSEYTKEAQSCGVNPEDLMDALIEISVFSYSKIQTIVQLIWDLFSYMAQTGYHKKRLGEIAPEIIELDKAFSRYYEEKILTSLLDACTLALQADSGSVMILDTSTNALYIKASSSIDQEVVRKTRVKMGEGIAGMAAATAQSIILPQDEKKRRLSAKMTRSNIKSSMIIPFAKGNSQDVYGVLNLNMARKGKEFSDKDIALVKELVNMAGVALIPIRQASQV